MRDTIILRGGVLQMRDPNDGGRHRYQYRICPETGAPQRRMLPSRGGNDTPWEPMRSLPPPPSLITDFLAARYVADMERRGHVVPELVGEDEWQEIAAGLPADLQPATLAMLRAVVVEALPLPLAVAEALPGADSRTRRTRYRRLLRLLGQLGWQPNEEE